MRTIGLTGGIASGKSTVARLLTERGARVIDSDAEARDVYKPRTHIYDAIVDRFGSRVLAPDGSIDRRALSRLVFGSPDDLRWLESVVWPPTRKRVEALKRQAESAGMTVLVIEAALLLEAGWRDLVDEVWLVRAPMQAAVKRLMTNNGLPEADARTRIALQPSDEARTPQADVIIDNDAGLVELAERVEAAWSSLQTRLRE
jgi:dephospho-CoA kinase